MSRRAHLHDLGEKRRGHTRKRPNEKDSQISPERCRQKLGGGRVKLSAGARQAEIGDYRVSQRIRTGKQWQTDNER